METTNLTTLSNREITEFQAFTATFAKSVVEFAKSEGIRDISTAYEMFMAALLTKRATFKHYYLDIDTEIKGININEVLLAFSKAGTYIKYAEYYFGILKMEKAEDISAAIFDAIEQKDNEDKPSDEAMEEIEKLMDETEEVLEKAEEEIEDSEEESEDNDDNKGEE